MQLIGSPAGREGLLINEQSLNTGLTGDVTNGMRTVIYDSSQCVKGCTQPNRVCSAMAPSFHAYDVLFPQLCSTAFD